MSGTIFKRKIYSVLEEWKLNSCGRDAILIEGARRVGKTTVVEEFARNNYRSHILINFARGDSVRIQELMKSGFTNLNSFS